MSDQKTVWIKFYPSDWLAGTRGMSAAESGVYITLIALMYERDGRIEMNAGRLARMCGTSNSAFKKALDVLIEEGKVTLNDGYLSQKRVLEELSSAENRKTQAAQAASARWEKSQAKSKADGLRQQSDGNADGMPRAHVNQSQSQKEKKETKVSQKGSRLPEDWSLPDDWLDWAISADGGGVTDELARAEAEKFRDFWHSVSGSKGVKRDWSATWRNWIRKAVENRANLFGQKPPPPKRKPTSSTDLRSIGVVI